MEDRKWGKLIAKNEVKERNSRKEHRHDEKQVFCYIQGCANASLQKINWIIITQTNAKNNWANEKATNFKLFRNENSRGQ